MARSADAFEHHRGERLLGTELAGEPGEERVQAGGPGATDVQLEVGAAGDVDEGVHLGAGEGAFAETVDVAGAHVDDGFEVAAQPSLVDVDGEPADDAEANESPDAVGGRVRRQVHPLTEGLVGDSGVVAQDGEIVKVFYPIFPPDRNAGDVIAALRAPDWR